MNMNTGASCFVIFKISIPISKKTQGILITEINPFIPISGFLATYYENHTKHISIRLWKMKFSNVTNVIML